MPTFGSTHQEEFSQFFPVGQIGGLHMIFFVYSLLLGVFVVFRVFSMKNLQGFFIFVDVIDV